MVRLNGNIPNINLGLSAGVIGLLVFTIIIGGFYVSETKMAAEQAKQLAASNSRNVVDINNTITAFVDNWNQKQLQNNQLNNFTIQKLVNISNISQEQENQLLSLTRNQTDILHTQLANQKLIINSTNQTNTLIKFLTDNFGENSGYLEKENFQYKQANDTFKAVNNISTEHQKILELLNSTR